MTSTNSDVNLVLINSYKHFFTSKLVNTFRLPHKHNFKLLSIWVVINVLSYTFIYLIILDWNINSNSCLEINDIITQSLNLCYKVFIIQFTLLKFFKISTNETGPQQRPMNARYLPKVTKNFGTSKKSGVPGPSPYEIKTE